MCLLVVYFVFVLSVGMHTTRIVVGEIAASRMSCRVIAPTAWRQFLLLESCDNIPCKNCQKGQEHNICRRVSNAPVPALSFLPLLRPAARCRIATD